MNFRTGSDKEHMETDLKIDAYVDVVSVFMLFLVDSEPGING